MLHDHHSHWLPQEVLELLSQRTHPPMASRRSGEWTFIASVRPRVLQPEAVNLEMRAKFLDGLGIGRQSLSLSPLWNIDGQPLPVALPLVRAFNDALARVVANSDRYEGWAAIPSCDVRAACAELRRAAALRLTGVVLAAPLLASTTQARQWDPLFALCAEKKLRVFVHPGQPTTISPAVSRDPLPWPMRFGLDPQHQIGTALLVATHGGLLLERPGLVMQFANLGGSFPGCLERLERMAEGQEETRGRIESLRQVVFDTASMGPRAIRHVRDLMRPGSVIFGTDMPIFDPRAAALDWRTALGPFSR